mgnify:CR=1 FL=1
MEKTRKLSIAFPVVGTIRKGGAKRPGKDRNGNAIEIVGQDLQDKFRVVFAPGAEDLREAWMKVYGTDQPTRIRAMVCFPSVWQAWEYYNEAYTAGRMVARADNEKFIVLRNPLTGEYIVRAGEPFRAYTPGQKITYEKNGREFSLPMKSSGRLRVFIPELGRMVMLELKTTSFYDCQNITNQLAAIQAVAAALNGGNAAGVPFYLYRKEQSITWNKPDGSASRVSKWLIQIEADPAYVETMVKRMSDFALTGARTVGQLPAGELAGTEDPDQPEDDDEAPVDAPWEEPEPEPEPAPAGDLTPRDILAAAPHDEQGRIVRPMAPEVARAALAVKAETKHGKATDKQRRLVAMLIEQAFSDLPEPKKVRHSVQLYLTGAESANDIPDSMILAILDWLKPNQAESGEYLIDETAAKELRSIWPASSREAGQMELF